MNVLWSRERIIIQTKFGIIHRDQTINPEQYSYRNVALARELLWQIRVAATVFVSVCFSVRGTKPLSEAVFYHLSSVGSNDNQLLFRSHQPL